MPAGHDISSGDVALREIQVKVIDDATVLTTGDGKTSFVISKLLNGARLVEAQASVVGVSSSGTPTVQIRRLRGGSPADMLSTLITIDVSELDSYTAAAPSVVDAANDDVATSDRLFVDVDVAGTGTDGLDVILTFAVA